MLRGVGPLGPRASRAQNTHAFASQRLAQSASGCRSRQFLSLGLFFAGETPAVPGPVAAIFDRTQASAGLIRNANGMTIQPNPQCQVWGTVSREGGVE